jgi:TPR repeat protein
VILPPQGFSGAVDIAAELRLADDTLVERQSLHLAMMTEKRMAPELAIEKTIAPELAIEKTTAPGLATEKTMITIFHLKRAEDLLAQGDISAARLALRRLAEVGNARAALLLGESYEGGADLAKARTWYENAAKFGSDEARRRLDRLGSEEPRGDLPLAESSQHPN